MSLTDFQRSYEISPIILNGGIASKYPSGMLPIIQLTQPNDFSAGPSGPNTGGGGFNPFDGGSSSDSTTAPSFDFDFVAHFKPLPGSNLIDLSPATYPLANQQVAANAIIIQPLRVSLLMVAPAPTNGGYSAKSSAFTSLQMALAKHNSSGGTYTVVTPSFTYLNCLLTGLRDVTSGEGYQVQTEWQWDFMQPLLTQSDADGAENTLMSSLSSGTQVQGDQPSWSGTDNTQGVPPAGGTPSLITSAQNLVAGGTGYSISSAIQAASAQAAAAFAASGAPSIASTLPSLSSGATRFIGG